MKYLLSLFIAICLLSSCDKNKRIICQDYVGNYEGVINIVANTCVPIDGIENISMLVSVDIHKLSQIYDITMTINRYKLTLEEGKLNKECHLIAKGHTLDGVEPINYSVDAYYVDDGLHITIYLYYHNYQVLNGVKINCVTFFLNL